MFEIKQDIINFKKLLKFNDRCFVFIYKFRNVEFKILFCKINILLLNFVFKFLNKEKFY